MQQRYHQLQSEVEALAKQLADPAIQQDSRELTRLHKEYNQAAGLAAKYQAYLAAEQEADDYRQAASGGDAELAKLSETELPKVEAASAGLKAEIEELERPKDPNDAKNVIVEIRSGAGGDEASLFASELYGMYQRYAESQEWKVELLSASPSEAGGYKEVIFAVRGTEVYGWLKFEAGTHRVQRVPVTESSGRIHTSTATVIVLPEAEDVEVDIKPEDIRVDVFRSSGPGGQSVNTTDSAVRITHQPTGITVSCQDEKSQHKNKAKAMSIMRARLKQRQEEETASERGDQRRSQVGSGDRSEKVRTYNFPQDRLTDHRIGFSRHGLDKVMAGDLESVLSALKDADRKELA